MYGRGDVVDKCLLYHCLNMAKGLEPATKDVLIRRIGIEKLFSYKDPKEISRILAQKGIKLKGDPSELFEAGFFKNARENYEKAKAKGIRIICPEDSDYPEGLKNIYIPPLCIYLIGRLPENKSPLVAIVGSRNCTDYGARTAEYFANELAGYGIGIISGMAKGIDGIAQRAAIRRGGEGIAVLGSGVDVIYPYENRDIYEALSSKGGIISEVPPGEPPVPSNFPRRNRIISALSDGILVIEAALRSGALITANYGLEQGKEIMAVPGRIDDAMSAGCLDIIRSGAIPVTSVGDVIYTVTSVMGR